MPDRRRPDWKPIVRDRLTGTGLDPARETEIVEELAQHLEARYEELLASGARKEEAQQATIEELSDDRLGAELRRAVAAPPARFSEEAESDTPFWAGVGRDLRHGARLLRRNPGFAVAAILSLALGIGANAAIFQLLDSVALRALPVKDPQQLTTLKLVARGQSGNMSGPFDELTYALWQRVQDDQQGFSRLGAWHEDGVNAGQGVEAHNVRALLVSGTFFQTLEVPPARGRLFGPADDPPDCGGFRAGGVVLSYAYWQSAYGGGSVLGQSLTLEGHPFPIIGVSAAGFTGLNVGWSFDVALPLCAEPMVDGSPALLTDPQGWWLDAVGRLNPGWTLARASAQLAAISPAIFAATVPPMYSARDRAIYLTDKLAALPAATGLSELRRQYEEPLWLLLGLAALVLLIACANLANLMLARAGARRNEMAVRLALGASRRQLACQLLVESLLLAAAGTLCGAAVGWLASRALVAFLSTADSRVYLDLAPDWRLLAMLAGLAVVACLLFGLAPAMQASRTAPVEVMKVGGRGSAGGDRSPLRRGLTIAQVALALVLLVTVLLFAATLRSLLDENPGFQPDHVVFAGFDLSPLNIPAARFQLYRERLLTRVRTLPGVQSAATVRVAPLSGNGWNERVVVPGSSQGQTHSNFNSVSPGYFATLHIPLIAGRDFAATDTGSAPAVAIVTQAFAGKFFNGANPVGRTFQIASDRGILSRPFTIVGLAGDSKYFTLREPDGPIAYLSAAQIPDPDSYCDVAIRSLTSAADTMAEVKYAARQIDPALTIDFTDFRQSIRDGLLRERLMAALAECFGGLALLLAVIGLYGVISYMALQRRKEMGIRVALGASAASIVRLILSEAVLLLAAGMTVGIALSVVAGRAARTLLFGISPSDPRTLATAIVGLAAAGALAALIPARRAAALDPMETLREE